MGVYKVFFPLILIMAISMSILSQNSFAEVGDYIVLDNTGNLLLVTQSGTITTIVTNLGDVDGLAVDAGGDFIVGDNFGNLLRVSSTGAVSVVVSGLGGIDAVAVDIFGNYIVGDNIGNTKPVEVTFNKSSTPKSITATGRPESIARPLIFPNPLTMMDVSPSGSTRIKLPKLSPTI